MTDILWGDPIPVDGKRPDWLRDDDNVQYLGTAGRASGWSFGCGTYDYRLPADHPYYTVQRHNAQNGTNFTYWPGGENAPDDWDGGFGATLLMSGGTVMKATSWKRIEHRTDIIGYTRRAEPLVATKQPAEWAIDRARAIIGAELGASSLHAFARYIEQHEQPPVDPDLVAVREIIAAWYEAYNEFEKATLVRDGKWTVGGGEKDAVAVYRKHRQ